MKKLKNQEGLMKSKMKQFKHVKKVLKANEFLVSFDIEMMKKEIQRTARVRKKAIRNKK